LDPKYDVELRKITFFLVLNTDASFKFDLKDDHTICHLLNAFSEFTKFLLPDIIQEIVKETNHSPETREKPKTPNCGSMSFYPAANVFLGT
jgi:hypothetical protein